MLKNFETDRVYRPRDYMILFWVISIIGAWIFYFWLKWHAYRIDKDSGIIFFIFGFFAILCLTAYLRISINLIEKEIIYKTLFKTQTVNFGEILKIETSSEIKGFHHSGVDIKYSTKIFSKKREVDINIKPYSKKAMIEFAKLLIENCINAEINKTTYEMAEGYLPSGFRIKSKAGW